MIHADKFVPHVDHRAPICDEFCRCMECKPPLGRSVRQVWAVIILGLIGFWLGAVIGAAWFL